MSSSKIKDTRNNKSGAEKVSSQSCSHGGQSPICLSHIDLILHQELIYNAIGSADYKSDKLMEDIDTVAYLSSL